MTHTNGTRHPQLPVARICAWCPQQLRETAKPEALFCSVPCRQAAYRARKLFKTEKENHKPLRLAYADPPYPCLSRKRYPNHPDGEVDHKKLIALLQTYDGWALSTSKRALRMILPLCPERAQIVPWIKPIAANPRSFGLHNCWEPLIVVPGRRLRPAMRDYIEAQPAKGGGDLMGRKPLKFCTEMFQVLGMLPGDSLDDIFPGTGIVGRTWRELSRAAADDSTKEAS